MQTYKPWSVIFRARMALTSLTEIMHNAYLPKPKVKMYANIIYSYEIYWKIRPFCQLNWSNEIRLNEF